MMNRQAAIHEAVRRYFERYPEARKFFGPVNHVPLFAQFEYIIELVWWIRNEFTRIMAGA